MSELTKRKNAPEGLKKHIIAGALKTFAEFGMQGARLEQVYQQIRQHETGLNLAAMEPELAMVRLVEANFDYHVAHPDFMRLVCSENLLRGRYISQSAQIKTLNRSALDVLDDILTRGQQQRLFIEEVQTIDVHRLISSICVHHVFNRYTFNALFSPDNSEEESIRPNRQLAVTATLRYIRK
ncbi:TetR/AcrR family transcriptional regulator [Pantoea sp. Eser]|nr:TetR/AcrR family transcriptional regulator [Pantoea sp. Eser]